MADTVTGCAFSVRSKGSRRDRGVGVTTGIARLYGGPLDGREYVIEALPGAPSAMPPSYPTADYVRGEPEGWATVDGADLIAIRYEWHQPHPSERPQTRIAVSA
jgi:hypothetical protein